jgi:hypothetical protein
MFGPSAKFMTQGPDPCFDPILGRKLFPAWFTLNVDGSMLATLENITELFTR